MQVVNKDEAIIRAMNGDPIYILIPIEGMNLKELGERVKTGATFMTGDPRVQDPPKPLTIIDNAKVLAPPPVPRRGATYDYGRIMSLYDAGWRNKDIAVEMDLTTNQVSGVVNRQLRKRKKEAGKNANKT
ncbi:MAG: hypothetical protein ACRC3H_24450 [Lachnospiraceae bacterium]